MEKFPLSGRAVPELYRDDIRELVFGNYRIVFRTESRAVSVLTVLLFRQLLPIEEVGDK